MASISSEDEEEDEEFTSEGGGQEESFPATVEVCDNGVDDDGDGVADVDDPEGCIPEPTVITEVCNNGLDDDGDGLADSEDAIDCPFASTPTPAPIPTPQEQEETPQEGGEVAPEEEQLPEGEDSAVEPIPTPTPEEQDETTEETIDNFAEICDNFADDDGDGLMDSEDTMDCPPAAPTPEEEGEQQEVPSEEEGPGEVAPTAAVEICDDGVDNDEDGSIDSQDTDDCPTASTPEEPTPPPEPEEEVTPEEESTDESPQAVVEICDNTLDDDGDGLVDSEDTEECPVSEEQEEEELTSFPSPEETEQDEDSATLQPELCDNGLDDDGDGLTDGEDVDQCPSEDEEEGEEDIPTEEEAVSPEQQVLPLPTPTPTLMPTPTPEQDEEQEEEGNIAQVETECDNGVDDEGDGLVDTDDTEDCPPLTEEDEEEGQLEDITPTPTPETPEEGEVPRDEQAEEGARSPAVEICDNGVDDDGDGLVDSGDIVDCPSEDEEGLTPETEGIPEGEEIPTEDGQQVVPQPEICDNGVDDDGDGLVDSEDADNCLTIATPTPEQTTVPEEGGEETPSEEEVIPIPTPTPTPEEEEEETTPTPTLTPTPPFAAPFFAPQLTPGVTPTPTPTPTPAPTPTPEAAPEEQPEELREPVPTLTPVPDAEEQEEEVSQTPPHVRSPFFVPVPTSPATPEATPTPTLTPTPTPKATLIPEEEAVLTPSPSPFPEPAANQTSPPTSEEAIEEPIVDQRIDQIAQQLEEQTDASPEIVQQVISQIALQIANAGGNVNQEINQLAQQIATNPSGPVSQSITQLAAQQEAGNTDTVNRAINQIAQQTAQGNNISQVINQQAAQVALGDGNIDQQITQVAQQIAQQTGTSQSTLQQTIQQIAIQIINVGGASTNVNQAINQIAQQIATNPTGSITQSITQIAQQIGSGNDQCANQAINQIAQQTAQGNNIVQVINQIVIQTSCPTPSPTPTPTPGPDIATLIVVKNVINDNGGTLEPSDFRISITGPAPNPPITSPFIAQDAPGTSIPVNADSAYQVSEITREGYDADYSSECNSNSGIPEGQTRTCTIVNNDESATLRVIKRVINDDGGTLRPSDFQISVTGPTELTPSPEGFPGRSGSGTIVEMTANTEYRVTETTSSRYNSDLDECRSSGGIPPGETRTCIITNNDKEVTDTTPSSIIEYRETTPVVVDVETIKFDKGIFEKGEILPLADVSPYVMIGGHVLLNVPSKDFKLIAVETSASGEIEHAVLLSPQRIGNVRTGQTLYHVDLDDKMSGRNPFTNSADKVTEWTGLWLYNSNKRNDIQVGDDNGWTATLVMAEFPGAKMRCPCDWTDTEIVKQGKSFFSANGMRVLADVRPFHVVDGHVALDLPRESGNRQSDVKLVAIELDNNNKVEHAVVINPTKLGNLNSAESLYHINLAEEMSGKNPFTNRADKVTEWTDLLMWNPDRKNGLAMVEDNQVSVTIVADR